MRAVLLSAAVIVGVAVTAAANDISGTARNDVLEGTPAADRIEGLGRGL